MYPLLLVDWVKKCPLFLVDWSTLLFLGLLFVFSSIFIPCFFVWNCSQHLGNTMFEEEYTTYIQNKVWWLCKFNLPLLKYVICIWLSVLLTVHDCIRYWYVMVKSLKLGLLWQYLSQVQITDIISKHFIDCMFLSLQENQLYWGSAHESSGQKLIHRMSNSNF